MNVLILGLSDIASRRVAPALRALEPGGRIDLGSRKAADAETRQGWKYGDAYPSYEEALRSSRCDTVYVSLVNSAHEQWAEAALRAGFHTIVDKPAFLSVGAAERLADLAATTGRCLAEATVFGYHPQITATQAIFRDHGTAPTRIVALLSFPPLAPNNFRYRASHGGGTLWDVGPYLVAAGRIFFGGQPVTTDCHVLTRGEEVETAFSALGTFGNGRSLAGHFGFDTAYCNRLQLLGDSVAAELDRAFTTPPDYENTIRVFGAGGTTTVKVPPADAFAEFFRHVATCIETGNHGQLRDDLLADARALHRYRSSAGVD